MGTPVWFKNGEKVLVKPDLVADRAYAYCYFLSSMEKYRGNKYTICNVVGNICNLKDADGSILTHEVEYKFSSEMLVPCDMWKVVHPSHYVDSCSLECIDVMLVAFGAEAVMQFCLINAFKYLWRYKNKNGSEDVEKAKLYLDKADDLIAKVKPVSEVYDKYASLREIVSAAEESNGDN